MKRLLVCMALLGTAAGPAIAEIAQHGALSNLELVPLESPDGLSLRNLTYDGANEVYDNLASDPPVSGLGPPVAWVSGNAGANWLFDDVHANTALNPTFEHMHVVLEGTNTGQLGGTSRTQIIGYFGNPGGLDSSHSGPL